MKNPVHIIRQREDEQPTAGRQAPVSHDLGRRQVEQIEERTTADEDGRGGENGIEERATAGRQAAPKRSEGRMRTKAAQTTDVGERQKIGRGGSGANVAGTAPFRTRTRSGTRRAADDGTPRGTTSTSGDETAVRGQKTSTGVGSARPEDAGWTRPGSRSTTPPRPGAALGGAGGARTALVAGLVGETGAQGPCLAQVQVPAERQLPALLRAAADRATRLQALIGRRLLGRGPLIGLATRDTARRAPGCPGEGGRRCAVAARHGHGAGVEEQRHPATPWARCTTNRANPEPAPAAADEGHDRRTPSRAPGRRPCRNDRAERDTPACRPPPRRANAPGPP